LGQVAKDNAHWALRSCCEQVDFLTNPFLSWQNCLRIVPTEIEDEFWDNVETECPELDDIPFCVDIQNSYTRLLNYISFTTWDLGVDLNLSTCAVARNRRNELENREISFSNLLPAHVKCGIAGMPYKSIKDAVDSLFDKTCSELPQ
jgi:hypothetical protein